MKCGRTGKFEVPESPKRGTTEKYYRAVAHQIRVDDSCLVESAFANEKTRVVTQMLDSLRHGQLNSLDSPGDDAEVRHTTAAFGTVELSDDQVNEFSNSCLTILDQWSKKGPKCKRKSKSTYPEPGE